MIYGPDDKRTPRPKHFAFVLMPFDTAFDDVYKLGIKGATEAFDDMVAERVDEQFYREGILDRIYRQIEAADIIIADMTGQNPNVFYEVGYAHAKGKLCILLTSDSDDIPFDLKHQRHIVYRKSIVSLRRELVRELHWARGELEKQRTSHIKVTPKMDGDLETTKYSATAKITLTLDLENTSDDKAVNINAIYFYSTDKWHLYQDDRECAFSIADQKFVNLGLKCRHFLQSPIQILQRGAWAQLKFEVRGTVANSFKGEPLKDSYHVRGRSVLRIITADGKFDYDIPIDTRVIEVPF